MSAIRLARGFTGRKYIIKFVGCYHGHADALLVKAGSGVATLGIPGSAGVPEEIVQLHARAALQRSRRRRSSLRRPKAQIACIIVEPVVGNMGCVLPRRAILQALRADHRASRRAADLRRGDDRLPRRPGRSPGALRDHARPDHARQDHRRRAARRRLRRRAEIMDWSPRSAPSTRPARSAATRWPWPPDRHAHPPIQHEARSIRSSKLTTGKIAEGVAELAREAGIPLTANRVGSMFTWFFTAGPVTDFASASASDSEAFARFHRRMMQAGVWLPPSQFEAAFVSSAHGQAEVEMVLNAAREALAQ